MVVNKKPENLSSKHFEERLGVAVSQWNVEQVRVLIKENPGAARALLTDPAGLSTVGWGWSWRLNQWPEKVDETEEKKDEPVKISEPKGKALRGILDLFASAGMDLNKSVLEKLVKSVARGEGELADIEWLLEHGALSDPYKRALLSNPESAFCRCFKTQSDQDLTTLARLVDEGVVKDAPGELGLTDFLAHGLVECAKLLSERGFTPRPVVAFPSGSSHLGVGADPITATAVGALYRYGHARGGRSAHRGEIAESGPEVIVERMRWVASLGAKVRKAPPASELSKLVGHTELVAADPFVGVLWAADDAPVSLVAPIFKALRDLGGDPNATGAYLGGALEASRINPEFGEQKLALALELGARAEAHPGRALAACIDTGYPGPGGEPDTMEMIRKVVGMGADPKKISKASDVSSNPVARAFESRRFNLAWGLVQMGASLEWVDIKDGSNLLHAMAGRTHPKTLAEMKVLSNHPEAKVLLNARALGGDRPGQTPLMRACLAMSPIGVEILLGAGADPNIKDDGGWTPLRAVASKYSAKALDRSEAIVSMLLARGADPGLADPSGRLPAQALAARGSLKALAWMVENRSADIAGDTPGAKGAKKALAGRGALAASVVERAELDQSVGAPVHKVTPSGARRKSRI